MSKPFTLVDMPMTFPTQSVADHQVFMSFINDADALAFREWWASEGAIAFQNHLDNQ